MRRVTVFSLAFLLWSYAQSGFAARAHIHGQGDLDVTVQGNQIELLLIAPIKDLQTEAAVGPEALAERSDLFQIDGTDCELISGAVTSADVFEDIWGEDAAEEADSGHDNDHDHDHDHNKEDHGHAAADHDDHHKHDDHHNHDGHDHNHDDGHDHDHSAGDEDDSGGHADSYISWSYRCSSKPGSLTVLLFADTLLERVRVQVAGATGATSETLTVDNNSITLP